VHKFDLMPRFVFVEESAEEVAPSDVRRVEGRCGRRIGSAAVIRRSQVECSVWTLLVEVADVRRPPQPDRVASGLATTGDEQVNVSVNFSAARRYGAGSVSTASGRRSPISPPTRWRKT
jgi:hypothetical protein